MDLTSNIAGFLLLAAGVWFGILAKQRRFNRTNEFGVERFPSFWVNLRRRSQDYILVGGCLLTIASGVILLSLNHLEGGGWVVMLPVSMVMLYLLLGT